MLSDQATESRPELPFAEDRCVLYPHRRDGERCCFGHRPSTVLRRPVPASADDPLQELEDSPRGSWRLRALAVVPDDEHSVRRGLDREAFDGHLCPIEPHCRGLRAGADDDGRTVHEFSFHQRQLGACRQLNADVEFGKGHRPLARARRPHHADRGLGCPVLRDRDWRMLGRRSHSDGKQVWGGCGAQDRDNEHCSQEGRVWARWPGVDGAFLPVPV